MSIMNQLDYILCVLTVMSCQVWLSQSEEYSRGALDHLFILGNHDRANGYSNGYTEYVRTKINPRIRRDTHDPHIQSMAIDSKLYSRFSETWIESNVWNGDNKNSEISFTVQIPEVALISNFTMVIDGIIYTAEVKEKGQAHREFEQARQDNKTAGLVSKHSDIQTRGMQVFSVGVTVASDTSAAFTLTYQELLIRTMGRYEKRINIRPNQVVQQLKADLWFYEPQGFHYMNVFEPSLQTESTQNQFTTLMNVSDTVKQVVYEPSAEYQHQVSPVHGIAGDLVVQYDLKQHLDAGEILYQDNYFVQYFSPDENQLTGLDKSIIFVIDISGSMDGIKIEQTRDAMLTILDQLGTGDRFMLLLFSTGVEYWPSSGEQAGTQKATINAAKAFVKERVVATGGTNINDALVQASKKFANFRNRGANMILFITDGYPTVGETSPTRIVSNVIKELNAVHESPVAIYSLAFGESLDYGLLEMLSYRTDGRVKNIYIDADVSEQLQNFFSEVRTPLLLNLRFIYPEDLLLEGELTRSGFSQYFQGSEVIVAGKLIPDAPLQWTVQVKADNFDVTKTVYGNISIPVELANFHFFTENFLEKLFVFFKIKDLLYQIKLTDDSEKQHILKNKALNLSLEYGLVTPLTSMIIVEEDTYVQQYDRTLSEAHSNSAPAASSIYRQIAVSTQLLCVRYLMNL